MIFVMSGGATELPQFTYTGDYSLIAEGYKKWRVKFLTSGTLTVEKQIKIDVFCVGPGGSSQKTANNYTYIGGPGGGYTVTELNVVVNPGSYEIVIGGPAAAAADAVGGTTRAFGVSAAAGTNANWHSNTSSNGYAGGSGGGDSGGLGGTDGSDGVKTSMNAGKGQGTTTREFGEPGGTLYSAGGNGTKSSGTHNTDGEPNTGNAANPGSSLRLGGSGIVVIRNHRG